MCSSASGRQRESITPGDFSAAINAATDDECAAPLDGEASEEIESKWEARLRELVGAQAVPLGGFPRPACVACGGKAGGF